jgi:hypothetical protein
MRAVVIVVESAGGKASLSVGNRRDYPRIGTCDACATWSKLLFVARTAQILLLWQEGICVIRTLWIPPVVVDQFHKWDCSQDGPQSSSAKIPLGFPELSSIVILVFQLALPPPMQKEKVYSLLETALNVKYSPALTQGMVCQEMVVEMDPASTPPVQEAYA